MKKEINYLLEYLSKSEKKAQCELYSFIVATLSSLKIYTAPPYTQEKVIELMQNSGLVLPQSLDETVLSLDKALEKLMPEALKKAKGKVFHTLIASNFPKKKVFLEHSHELFVSQLEPVEKNIYNNLSLYVLGLNRSLGIFYGLYADDKTLTPEIFVSFGNALHQELIRLIYNEKELELLERGLKELLGVYLSLYGKYLFSENL